MPVRTESWVMVKAVRKLPVKFLVMILRVYQYCLSPFLGNRCRFYPSCSQYAVEAIVQKGVFAGLLLSIKRLGKCHPWHPGGVDLLVETENEGMKRVVN